MSGSVHLRAIGFGDGGRGRVLGVLDQPQAIQEAGGRPHDAEIDNSPEHAVDALPGEIQNSTVVPEELNLGDTVDVNFRIVSRFDERIQQDSPPGRFVACLLYGRDYDVILTYINYLATAFRRNFLYNTTNGYGTCLTRYAPCDPRHGSKSPNFAAELRSSRRIEALNAAADSRVASTIVTPPCASNRAIDSAPVTAATTNEDESESGFIYRRWCAQSVIALSEIAVVPTNCAGVAHAFVSSFSRVCFKSIAVLRQQSSWATTRLPTQRVIRIEPSSAMAILARSNLIEFIGRSLRRFHSRTATQGTRAPAPRMSPSSMVSA